MRLMREGERLLAISFHAHKELSAFHDPMQEGKLISRETEIRLDPLTGESSRILFDPGAPFMPSDYSEVGISTSGSKCPFCSENVWKATPAYPEQLINDGKLSNGEAILFPNLFPYAKHNGVVRMTEQHYVPLEQFSEQVIYDSLRTAHTYLQKAIDADRKTDHLSINWNYLPPSGGSILHPHLHVLASEKPTNYDQKAIMYSERYYNQFGTSFYADLLDTEKQLQQRWIGRKGSMNWLHAYAPKSHYDFIGLFEHMPAIAQLQEQDWRDLASSMLSFFSLFKKIGVASFNMMIILPKKANAAYPAHIRIVPRLTLGALGTSDMNVFTFLHGEYLSLKTPERTAKEAAAFF